MTARGTGRAPGPVASRSRLLTLLSEACELEHGLLCSYLYAAFSLKQDLSEGGITWQQQQKVRWWAGQIYAVAAEEMLHLAQAWNLLAAIGGTPYYYRPGFPQPAAHYDLNLPLALTPFSEDTLMRFVMYELPSRIDPLDMAREIGLAADQSPTACDTTVGELYASILESIDAIPETDLFLGSPERQIGQNVVDFPGIVRVKDRESATAAIEMIMGQGEGTQKDDLNCHFGMFLRLLADYRAERKAGGASFTPVRSVAHNPVTRLAGFEYHHGATLIEEPFACATANYFNAIYDLMLRQLQFAFSNSTECSDIVTRSAKHAIVAMTTVLKPIGEALMLLPVKAGGTLCAGPPFGLFRYVPLPPEIPIATRIVRERLAELVVEGNELCRDERAPVYLRNAVRNLVAYVQADTP